MLISRFKNCSGDVKVCLFRSFLSNIYGCSLWYKFRNIVCMIVLVHVHIYGFYPK